jgi:hypothetical protein
MKTGISVFLAGFVLAAGVAAVAPPALAADGKAEGTLTVNGKTTPSSTPMPPPGRVSSTRRRKTSP